MNRTTPDETRIRSLDPQGDLEAVTRIWREIGWIEEESQERLLIPFLRGSWGLVGEIRGEPEVCVTGREGAVRYLDERLRMWGVTSVVVSRIARKQGLAGRLTAKLTAEGARRGCTVAMLGMFEQGYYDRLGYGTGSYERFYQFDPASLAVRGAPRPPRRLDDSHFEAMHAGILRSTGRHGCAWFPEADALEAELLWSRNGFGLGYLNEEGTEVTHFLWMEGKGEHGPYRINFYSYTTGEQFLELLRLIRSLGDQVHAVWMKEPPGIMLQDFLHLPFKQELITSRSPYEVKHTAEAFAQLRILDLETAVAACSGAGELDLRVRITDPLTGYLDPVEDWQGLAGVWDIHLGRRSSARRAEREDLPPYDVETDIGAFSRLWIGAATAHSLSIQGRLRAEHQTVEALDRYFTLPEPHPGWDF